MRAFAKTFSLSILGITFLAAVLFYTDSDILKIQNISVRPASVGGAAFMFSKIKEELNPQLQAFVGKSILDVELEDIYDLLEGDRRVKEARVTRQFPNGLKIEIEPHVPIANILNISGRSVYPLTKEGSLFPSVPFQNAGDAPVVRGQIFLKNADLRKQLLTLLKDLPEAGEFSRSEISEVSYDSKKGFVLVLSRDATQVFLGNSEFSKRLAHVRRVVQYLRAENLKGRVIDARFSKKVVVRLRNAS